MNGYFFEIVVDGPVFKDVHIRITGYLYYETSDGSKFFSFWTSGMKRPEDFISLNLEFYTVSFFELP